MPPGKSPRRAGACSIAALAFACALAPASASAAVSRPSDGNLSARLAELAKPSVRSAPPAAQARALSLATEGPGSLLREGNRVLVEVRFDHGAAAGVNDLRSAGAKIVNVSPRYQTVTVAAKPSELQRLSTVPGAAASEILAPITAASTCPSGVAVSEGDAQVRAAEARTAFGVDGAGVSVGVLSDSFNRDGFAETHEGEDVESGDLPGSGNTCPGQAMPVNTALDDYEPGPEESAPEDEGRAMAQIIHDLAPGAELSFATAFTGLPAFASNVEALAAAGAKVIADDVSYFEEPFFQEGPVGVAVSKVTASGVNYFSSARNNNLIASGGDTGSPRLKFALLENGGGVTESEYPESIGEDTVGPTIFGHNGAQDAVSVGAVPVPPFYEDEPESYSSRGPVTHYFGPVNGTTPAIPLVTPAVLSKPDIVATDGGANTFFGSCVSHTWRVFGTSAAAPHAAAVAALERQAAARATVAEVRQAMLETAGPVGVFPRPGPAVGAGIVNAGAAIAKLKSEPFLEPIIKIPPPAPQNCELPEPSSPGE